MADEKGSGDKPGEGAEASAAAPGQEGMELPSPAGEKEESSDLFDLGLDKKSSFRMLRKTVRHYVAHEEYGVIFSFCGIRTTRKQVEYDPEPKPSEMRCEKCKETIWQVVASTNFAKKMKEKKDLGD